MKYMVLIYGSFAAWNTVTPKEQEEILRVHQEVTAELAASGELIASDSLSMEDARVLRRQSPDMEPVVTDGPFAEVTEVLAGFYLLDCASIDRATQIAARFRESAFAPVEVRQVTG